MRHWKIGRVDGVDRCTVDINLCAKNSGILSVGITSIEKEKQKERTNGGGG